MIVNSTKSDIFFKYNNSNNNNNYNKMALIHAERTQAFINATKLANKRKLLIELNGSLNNSNKSSECAPSKTIYRKLVQFIQMGLN